MQLTHDESQDENISTLLDNKAFDDALQKELRGLDPQSRTLFSLRYEEDMPIGQIAMIMDIPEGT
ncbi:MAG: sigma-70 family RNA polymerase sigma factor, partial [Bacteroidaceae bacterium]|nr:sigma-70 family RNA polymerase sigma factor [Bacteroidaceae bacterium]